jgi:membrane protein
MGANGMQEPAEFAKRLFSGTELSAEAKYIGPCCFASSPRVIKSFNSGQQFPFLTALHPTFKKLTSSLPGPKMHLFRLVHPAVRPKTAITEKASPWKLGGLTPWQLLMRVYREFDEDEVFTRSAALAYYFLSALFPMIFFLTAVLGLFAKSHDLQSGLGTYSARFMPLPAYNLVQKTLTEIARNSSGRKLVFGLTLAVWAGSGGVISIMDALNRCYHVSDSRPWWKRRLHSIALTIAISALVIVALVIVLYGGSIATFLGEHVGLSAAAVNTWRFVQWPIALLFVMIAFALLYYWGTAVEQKWQWITPGSLVGVFLWIGVSLLFRSYLHFFNTFSRTYGSLGAVIVLLLWLYITALAILVGAEINSEIDNAMAVRTHPEVPESRPKAA